MTTRWSTRSWSVTDPPFRRYVVLDSTKQQLTYVVLLHIGSMYTTGGVL